MPRVPSLYRKPHGLPLRWQDEASGELPKAVHAYLSAVPNPGQPSISAAQVELICDYLAHYINAPCWQHIDAMLAEFLALRQRVGALKSAEEIDVWISDALKIGIDPL